MTAPQAQRPPVEPPPAPVVAGLLLALFAAFGAGTLNDGDTFSHVRTGLWILDHRAVPHVDVFSSTFRGRPWTAHEWLAEVLFGLAYLARGWAGVLGLTAAATGLAAYLLGRALARRVDGVALLAATGVGAISFMSGLLARPHMLALPILILWIDRLVTARRSGAAPGPVATGLLMLLWANLHGGWAFGLGLLGLFTAERLWAAPSDARTRLRCARGWLAALAVASAAACVTPNGIEGVLFPLRLSMMPNISVVREWQSADFSTITPLELTLLGVLAVGLTGRARLDGFAAALLLLMAHMALQHRRHEVLLGVTAPLLLADAIFAASGAAPRPAHGRGVPILAAAAGIVAIAVRLAIPVTLADSAVAAPTALAHVPPSLRAQPVFNSYGFGGYLILEGSAPFIDGRADMFGKAFLERYMAILRPDAEQFRLNADRYGVRWTLLRPNEPLVRVLDHTPGWRRIYSDNTAVVHVRS